MTPSSFEERFDKLFGTPADLIGTMTFKSMDMVHQVKTLEATKQFGDAVKAFIKSELDKQRVEIEGEYKKRAEKLKKPNEVNEDGNCLECGDYDECDCGGYNQALLDMLGIKI
jgi:hypothetical protein